MPVLYALGILCVLVAIVCGCYAFRNTSGEPTETERYLATAWLIIRRIACFSFALGSLVFAAQQGWLLASNRELLLGVGVVVLGLLVSVLCVCIGIFGIARHWGWFYSYPYLPIAKYREDKKRYGWRW